MEFLDSKTIKLDTVVNELDRFVFDFIKILEKHAEYVIVSGYVAILFGRSRATEDIDVFIKEMSNEQFALLYGELKRNGYWCINGESVDGLYEYLAEGLALRFALSNELQPNFEVKFAKKRLDFEAFPDALTVITGIGKLKVSSLERQIAFKQHYLKSDKDLEDALHLEKVFKGHLDTGKIKAYKRRINEVHETRKDE